MDNTYYVHALMNRLIGSQSFRRSIGTLYQFLQPKGLTLPSLKHFFVSANVYLSILLTLAYLGDI